MFVDAKDYNISLKNHRIVSAETRKKIAEARKGHAQTEETRKKIAEAAKNRVFSEETRKKISEAAKKRPKFTEEHRKKISQNSGMAKKARRFNGKTNKEWAEHYNVGVHMIYNHLAKYGNLDFIGKTKDRKRLTRLEKKLKKEEANIEIMRGEA